MSSAWKLLYAWRSGGARRTISETAAAADSDLRRPTRHRHGHQRDDPSPRVRNLCHRAAQTEHGSVWLVDRRSTVDLENSNGNGVGLSADAANRASLIRNHQLPDAVAQARERLNERLRHASLRETSHRASTTSSRISLDEHDASHGTSNNEFVDARDETARYLLNSDPRHANFTSDEIKKQPYVGPWEVLCALHLDIFINSEEIGEMEVSPECCVCLESFIEGDKLIRLHCRHRFHPTCLEPWIQTCSDCPYCRASMTR